MYTPSYKTKKNGMPVLSKDEIDNIAERYLLDFNPATLQTPQEIDIDGFAFNYLKLNQDFHFLSHNGIYLGMMVFNDTKKIPVYIPEKNEAEYVTAKARTMIIDNSLVEENQERRYRYTVGHECGHDIFHRSYYVKGLPNQISMFTDMIDEPLIRCRVSNYNNNKDEHRLKTEKDWMEWQSNYMSSALLMPKSMVIKVVKSLNYDINDIFTPHFYVNEISEIFNVSSEAAKYRLEGLGCIKKNSVNTTDFDNSFLNLTE